MATNFEAITKNPETLAAFLRALPILEGPWDEEFQRNYCAGCGKVSRIHPDTYDGTGCIVVSAELAFATGQTLKFLNPDTLQDDYNALERYCKRAQRDDLKDWVLTNGADYCCEEVKRIWERG